MNNVMLTFLIVRAHLWRPNYVSYLPGRPKSVMARIIRRTAKPVSTKRLTSALYLSRKWIIDEEVEHATSREAAADTEPRPVGERDKDSSLDLRVIQ